MREIKNWKRRKLFSSLIFGIFLIGSTIIYSQLGKWVAIGVALEVLSIYLLIKFENYNSINDGESIDNEIDEKD